MHQGPDQINLVLDLRRDDMNRVAERVNNMTHEQFKLFKRDVLRRYSAAGLQEKQYAQA